MEKKILITGGSGFLGINLIRFLLGKGENYITSLDIAGFDYHEKDVITAVQGDIRDRTLVRECMKDVTWVIHTAAALPLYKKADIFSTDIDGTRNLLEAAFENSIERFVHISSTAVYGIPDHHPIYEDDLLDGVGPYGHAKIKAEECCADFRKKGMCISILRPKTFVGPERLGIFTLLYDWAKDGRNFPLIGSGNNQYQLLDVEDLCEAVYLCLTKDKEIVNDTFNIGAKDFATMRKDFQAVLDHAGFGKRVIGFPATPVIWALRTLEVFRLSPLYKWVYETACEDSFVSIEKAEKKLGFEPGYSNKDALIRNFKWYLENAHTLQNQDGISHRTRWKQGVLRLFKLFF